MNSFNKLLLLIATILFLSLGPADFGMKEKIKGSFLSAASGIIV